MKLRYYLPRWLRWISQAQQILFLSFTRILQDINCGLVREKHFKQGLFYFQATRVGVLEPDVARTTLRRIFSDDMARGQLVYELLVGELADTEAHGRVLWRERDEDRSYQKLSDFLVRHGYPPMPKELLEKMFVPDEVRRWAEREKLPLAVFA